MSKDTWCLRIKAVNQRKRLKDFSFPVHSIYKIIKIVSITRKLKYQINQILILPQPK